MMSRRKNWPATACMPSRQLAGCPPRPRSIGWSPSSWLACSPHHRGAHLGDGGSPAGIVAVVGHVRPDLADGPVDLHAAHHLHQWPSQASIPSCFNSLQYRRLGAASSSTRRRQTSQQNQHPWLAFLLSRWLGGRVPTSRPELQQRTVVTLTRANRAWSGPSADHGSSAGCLG